MNSNAKPKKQPTQTKPASKTFKTGVQGKVWGKQNQDWIPSLYLSPVRS